MLAQASQIAGLCYALPAIAPHIIELSGFNYVASPFCPEGTMPDLLVDLLRLPAPEESLGKMKRDGILIRRAQPFEITPVRSFIASEFYQTWADEVSVGFANKPVSLFIATMDKAVVGFAGYECTRRNFLGPVGVAKTLQGRGVGKALVIAALWGLREMGYVYGIVGRVGPVEFYEKAVGAIVIPDSNPGIYTDLLK